MKKELLYKATTIILLILNLGMVGYLLWGKKSKSKITKPNAVKIVNLDDNQNSSFRQIGNNHGKQMNALRNKQKQCVQEYFKNPSDSLLNCIKNIEAEKIKITEEHFENMKSVLNNEQLPLYEDFKEKAVKYILQ